MYDHTKDPSPQASEATGSAPEHPDISTIWKDQMGTCALAVGLLDPSMGMGGWSLEQVAIVSDACRKFAQKSLHRA